jgi:hypothetical protein
MSFSRHGLSIYSAYAHHVYAYVSAYLMLMPMHHRWARK